MMLRKILLVCGLLSSLLYVSIDLLAAIRYGDYHRFASQAISELMARGAPTERLVDPLFLLYGVLVMAFAAGVWMSSDRSRVHLTAGLLFAYAALGFLGPTLFEMNMRGTGDSRADLLHIVLTSLLGLLALAAVWVGASTWQRSFRLYSLATLLVLVVFAVLTALASRGLSTGRPTPWLGIAERIEIGAFLLWVMVLADSLLRAQQTMGRRVRLRPA
ncbi:MAG TPA: DUF998 domain-containing protein [Myxococcales bacterium]